MAIEPEVLRDVVDKITQDRPALDGFVEQYFEHVPPEDVAGRTASELAGLVAEHLEVGAVRPARTDLVEVRPPQESEHGGSTRVFIVTDDRPFLVNSVTMEIARRGWTVRTLLHPRLRVGRDATDALTGLVDAPDGVAESWMCLEVFAPLGQAADTLAGELAASLGTALTSVRAAVDDRDQMSNQVRQTIDLLNDVPQPVSPHEVRSATELLEWMAARHFVFLGYREYEYVAGSYRPVAGTGLGILRGDSPELDAFHAVPIDDVPKLLVVVKDSRRSVVHRPAYLDYIGVRLYNRDGTLAGERRFLGLWAATAYREPVTRVPVIAAKAQELLKRSGYDRDSHAGRALWEVISSYPRDELLQASVEELYPPIIRIAEFKERRQVRLFVRRGAYGRFLTCLVFLPRDRFTTDVRLKIQQILMGALGGDTLEYQTSVTESVLARLVYVIKRPDGAPFVGDIDVPSLEQEIAEATRSWDDGFEDAAQGLHSEERGVEFSDAYEEEFGPDVAVKDLGIANGLGSEDELAYDLYRPLWPGDEADVRFKVFSKRPMSLTAVMPHLSVLGVEVIDERPYEWDLRGQPLYLYDFGLRLDGGAAAAEAWGVEDRQRFIDAFDATYRGLAESGRFNKLVMTAGLTWRQITWLRSMSRYLIQAGIPYSQPYVASALNDNPQIAAALVRAFEAKFDPAGGADLEARGAAFAATAAEIDGYLANVASLDQDRILRMFMSVLSAMIRTNAFSDDQPALAFKLLPRELSLLPEPRPRFEIFVYSPRVQGVHLRFGAVARGGLRWSDRKEDFRTEVLGLVKAQMVKNTVIVPVGAKGGFVPQSLPDPAVDRAAWLAEGVACYETFIASLLSITDTIVDGTVVPPAGVVRFDGDDPYLVVAADKGTATFSDIANRISVERGFWLGDAFASGGSAGYDHKGMGITARGAWESVKRHFVEMGRDCQTEDFTCVGIGDMAGDVFGNGMLRSRHTKLVGAFNHQHIFLDPNPDPTVSFAERERLFRLPRSTWADYDTSLISSGGGVFARSLKSIPLTPEVREVLGISADTAAMTPAELIHAMLQAPVDLLWNGGIGTYVKSASETNAEVGDRANDAVRVNGAQVRAQCVGEGGNLGLTQRGRIEYALAGGRLNTDFIDNSAGVDTSDHEVNIKILLAPEVAAGRLTFDDRNELLAGMTDEVAQLVLAHNVDQNLALANSEHRAADAAGAHESWMRDLEQAGYLNRELEYLPSSVEMAERIDRGAGLTRPELSTLLAYTKIYLKDGVLASELPDDPYLADRLIQYFPKPLQQRYADQMPQHRLAREIITTVAVNRFVNSQGITAFHRLAEETGAGFSDIIRAQLAARSIFALGRAEVALGRIEGLPAEVVTDVRLRLRRMVERATRWLLANRRAPLDIVAAAAAFTDDVAIVRDKLGRWITPRQRLRVTAGQERLVAVGVPPKLATQTAEDGYAHFALPIVEIAHTSGVGLETVAKVYFQLADHLGLDQLGEAITALPQRDRWQTMARAALRDDLLAVQGELVHSVLAGGDHKPEALVSQWLAEHPQAAAKAALIRQVADEPDVAKLSVGVRQGRSLLASS